MSKFVERFLKKNKKAMYKLKKYCIIYLLIGIIYIINNIIYGSETIL